MEGVWLNGATVRPQSFLRTSHSSSLPSSSAEASLSRVRLPGSTASENASCLRRLRSDVPNFKLRRSSRSVVTAQLDSSLLHKSKRRAGVRVSSVAAPVAEVADLGVTADTLEIIFRESLFQRLEHAYKQPTFEVLVSDLEAKLQEVVKDVETRDDSTLFCSSTTKVQRRHSAARSKLDVVARNKLEEILKEHVAETSFRNDLIGPSNSTPKVVRKRNPRRPVVAGDQIVRITKNVSTRRPRRDALTGLKNSIKKGAELVENRGGKRRLSLLSRIAMKEKKQERFTKASNSYSVDTESLKPEDQELWSQEAEDLINKYSISLDLTAPLWENLDRGLLTANEECALAMRLRPMKKLEKLRMALVNEVGREPSDEEWASAAKLDSVILRRQISLSRAARLKLIQHNLRLVLSQAHKYYKESMSLSLQDLCQEGVVGLMHAVDKFDPKKGYRFSTYGIYWIRNSILRAQTKSGHMLRSPVNVSMHRVNIKRAAMELRLELDRPPTDDEIMKHLGIAADRFRDIKRTNMRTLSLHEHDRITGRERVENLVDNEDAMSAVASKTSMLRYGIDDVLDSLRPKENMVLRQRFGLDGKGERSLSEVGFNLNLSREMVRRYELRGILRMKHPTRVDYLRNYLA